MIVFAVIFIGFTLLIGAGGWMLWDLDKERRGYDQIAKVMRRQRDECRKAGEPWVAGRAWPQRRK